MNYILYGPNVFFALLGAGGVFAMFLSLFAAAPAVGAGTLDRFADAKKEELGWRGSLQRKLDQADLDITAGEFVKISLISAVVLGVVGYAITRTYTGAAMALLMGPFGYWTYLEGKRDKNRQKYQEGLARATAIIRDSVSAGKGLRQSIEDVARRGPKAVRGDFSDIINQLGVGITLQEAMEKIRLKRRDPVFDVLTEVLLVHEKYGGRVAAVLERLAESTRRRTEVRRRVQAEQARIVWEARGVSLAPFIVLMLTRLSLPGLTDPFYSSPMGEFAVILVGLISAGSYYLVVRVGAAPLKVLETIFVAPEE